MTTGTQDDCDRDYFFWRKLKQSADFEADDYDSQEEEEDQKKEKRGDRGGRETPHQRQWTCPR